MNSRTVKRYIWLLNTLLQHNGLTLKEISDKWESSCLGDGEPFARRTFFVHREAIAELFGVEIACDKSTNRYYIPSPEKIYNDSARKWLLNSFTMSNMIEAGHNMKDRILFEEIPNGTEYLQTVIEAMQQNKVLKISYRRFGKSEQTFSICPYAMKVYHQRWYVVGYIMEQGNIRNIALDRVSDMEITTELFMYPDDFDAKEYYRNTVGIFVNEKLKPQNVTIRAYDNQAEYLRTLPLHQTQKETVYSNSRYSDFHYNLCLTPELTTQLLSMGDKIEVLEPEELRGSMRKAIIAAMKRYK